MTGRPAILVTDGEQRSALAVVRSLGAAGYPVFVGHTRSDALAAASRLAARRIRLPSPADDAPAWRAAVRRAVDAHGIQVILPVTEPGLLAALDTDAPFGQARIAGPSLHAFQAIRDKQRLLQRARTLGIDVPRQHVVETPDRAHDAALIGFPAVLKPARSVFEQEGRMAAAGVTWARDAAGLRSALEAFPAPAFPVLVQEYVDGPGIGVFALLWDGRCVATFCHRRVREKPPWGGVSVCSESVPLDAGLVEASIRLLRSYDWQGPAMVEYKRDEATGRAVLMEVNGRFWGSLQLAIHAGVDFPRLLVGCALGSAEPGPSDYRIGIRNHWEWGELDAAWLRWRRSDPVTGRRASLASVARDLLRLRPGRDRAEVFRLTDPLPFLRESLARRKRS